MKFTRQISLFFTLTLAWLSAADFSVGWQHIGSVTAVSRVPQGVELQAGQARVRVVAVSESVFRVRVAPQGKFGSSASWAVLPTDEQNVAVRVEDAGDVVELSIAKGKARIMKSPLRIEFRDVSGNLVSQDYPGLPMAWRNGDVRVWKSMPPDENYYGLGEKAGPLNRRKQSYTMWNTDAFGWQESTDPLYKSIPFFLALRNGISYGVFLDNTYRSTFDFGKESGDFYSFGAPGGELDYYFFFGPHPKKVIEEYTALTGRTPLPPLWSLGYQQCRYSYYPESRVREVARTLREKNIPADVIYLDIDYQDGNRPFTVDRKRFPNFEEMIRDLHGQGFKVIAITDLHLKKEVGYPPYDQGMAGDHFVKNPDGSVYVGVVWPGDSVFPEFTRAESRAWWGTLYRDFVRIGINGFWNDMNEPAIFQRDDKTMPPDTVHRLDDGSTRDHRAIHNVYGMLNARATYEGLRQLQADVRPFVLTRAAFAGAQRYAATWTGDNSSTWNHYRLTVPTLLGLGVSGYALVGNDVGGFAGSPTADLLTRWIQLGVFTPIFRNHTMKDSANQEPWVHGPRHEAIRRRYIELRYRLLPYIYTVTEETSRTGLPMMRPLFLEYPESAMFYGNDRQFLFGRDLLVAADLDESIDSYDVSLPPGGWFDYWTGKRIKGEKPPTELFTPEWVVAAGPSVVKLSPKLDEMPVFVRAGAIIPHQPIVQHSDEQPNGPLELQVYPGPECAGSLYLDDGKTFAYQRGESLRVSYSCTPAKDALGISISARQGKFSPWWKRICITVFGVSRPPKEVRAADRPLKQRVTSDAAGQGWQHNFAKGTVTLSLADSAAGWQIQLIY